MAVTVMAMAVMESVVVEEIEVPVPQVPEPSDVVVRWMWVMKIACRRAAGAQHASASDNSGG